MDNKNEGSKPDKKFVGHFYEIVRFDLLAISNPQLRSKLLKVSIFLDKANIALGLGVEVFGVLG